MRRLSRSQQPDHPEPVPVTFDWRVSTLLVKVSVLSGGGLLPRVRHVQPGSADIQVLIGFANFYQCFRFSKIAAPLASMAQDELINRFIN